MRSAPPANLPTPCRLGRYELLGEIAAGGMATVYLARMTGKVGFERVVAVKVLHPHLSSDRGFVAMFLDEAGLCARIQHPNVVDVYDVDVVDGRLILVMGYIEGASLYKLLSKGRRTGHLLPVGFIARVVRDSLRGLHAAHQLDDGAGEPLGLVHRDVSPQNILVGTDGIARMADFGIAKARGRVGSTNTDMIKGKLRYLAPEQVRRETVDRRTDVFAAGVVLWESLAGQPLFTGDSEAAMLGAVLAQAIDPPSRHRNDVTPGLDSVCLTALSREIDLRYETAADFADALELEVASEMLPTGRVGELVSRLSGRRLREARALLGRNTRPGEAAVDEAMRGIDGSDSSQPGPSDSSELDPISGESQPASGRTAADSASQSGVSIASALPATGTVQRRASRRSLAFLAGSAALLGAALTVVYLSGPSQSPAAASAVSSTAEQPRAPSAPPSASAPVASAPATSTASASVAAAPSVAVAPATSSRSAQPAQPGAAKHAPATTRAKQPGGAFWPSDL